MSAILMDGKKSQEKILSSLANKVEKLKAKGIFPKLVVVVIGNDPASAVYVRNKQRASEKVGILFDKLTLDENTTYEELKDVISKLNFDKSVHGILVQLPLPKHFSTKCISILIDPKKDADGVNPLNQGINFTKENVFAPKSCTPNGIMELLREYDISLSGKNVLIIGRSNIVGRPLSYLLMHENATVTMVHTKTSKETFALLAKNADIIVSAAGIQDSITPEMVKKGVAIIDVGILRQSDGTLRGDVDYKKFMDIASFITPVPGGVGPMTVAMLLTNVVTLTDKFYQSRND